MIRLENESRVGTPIRRYLNSKFLEEKLENPHEFNNLSQHLMVKWSNLLQLRIESQES